ncbi:DUF2382 domain-containing protein [Flaviaesturariibacter flavus]|uniref:DUF2382 domain-containing protein n=1 Tax=Flaviaesturariibacter flavus TaxID=2502780 RepID=A0A4R1B5Q9_9BACT|nr:YsnF/AvaK domain-containing protein [Flaviaesturariibacter flavus]TCJ13331.1 DUF2382 domain-containing protein [Flaviaesturariibacter flavus]
MMNQENQRIILGPDGKPVHSQPASAVQQAPLVKNTEEPVTPGTTAAQNTPSDTDELVIPVVQEFMTVDKEVVETGRINIRTTVHEKEETINIPLLSEYYDVQRVPKKDVYAKAPVPRQEGDVIIVPVVKEILVIEKRYEVTEEVHLIRKTTSTPHIQQIVLLKEQVEVVRTDTDGNKKRL